MVYMDARPPTILSPCDWHYGLPYTTGHEHESKQDLLQISMSGCIRAHRPQWPAADSHVRAS
jgi:hypothetical protein